MKMEMTCTSPLQFVNINGVIYLLTPVQLHSTEGIVKEFSEYLDELDPEIFNKANEEYGKEYDLSHFSTLFTSEQLTEQQINELKECITIYKGIASNVIQERIFELVSFLDMDETFSMFLEKAMRGVEACISYAELNNLTDSQEFLDWEDDLNALSVRDHNLFQESLKEAIGEEK